SVAAQYPIGGSGRDSRLYGARALEGRAGLHRVRCLCSGRDLVRTGRGKDAAFGGRVVAEDVMGAEACLETASGASEVGSDSVAMSRSGSGAQVSGCG